MIRLPGLVRFAGFLCLCTVGLAACASRSPEVDVSPGLPEDRDPQPTRPPDRAETPEAERGFEETPGEPIRLPAIPPATGPPRIHVQYPKSRGRIGVRDSNFIFGTVMTGEAELEIDGHPVRVEPNGAFLAWLPVPVLTGQDAAEYLLAARGPAGGDMLRHRVRLPPEPYEGEPGTVWIDAASLPREVERWMLPGDPLPFAVRAAPGLAVAVQAEDVVQRLREATPGQYEGSLDLAEILERLCQEAGGEVAACVGPDQAQEIAVQLSATDGRRTASETIRFPVALLDPDELPVVELHDEPDPVHGRTDVVVGRPTPYGTYRWLFPQGSRGVLDRRVGDRVRMRLPPDLSVWLAEEDTELVPGEGGGWTANVGRIRLDRRSGGVTAVTIPLDRAVPAHVEETEEGEVKLILPGARAGPDGPVPGGLEGSESGELERLTWHETPNGGYELRIRPRRPLWGHRLSYPKRNVGEVELLLELRSPPPVDPAAPLRGRRIAVDAGHPPVGAFGPTGLYEGDANLAIARRLVRQLEEQGALPIMIRADTLPLGLYDRTGSAIGANAELFVSIHNNALPDGVRPFGEEGTSTYYYHPHSRPLAEAVQAGLVSTMGLRDLGVMWGSFAVVRMPWMPSVLAEGAFMMFPRHEAALRVPDFQEAYARGVLSGIRSFLRRVAIESGAAE